MKRLGIVLIVDGTLTCLLAIICLFVPDLRILGISPFAAFLTYAIAGGLSIFLGFGFIYEHYRLEEIEEKCNEMNSKLNKLCSEIANENESVSISNETNTNKVEQIEKDQIKKEDEKITAMNPLFAPKKQNNTLNFNKKSDKPCCKNCGNPIDATGYCSYCNCQN